MLHAADRNNKETSDLMQERQTPAKDKENRRHNKGCVMNGNGQQTSSTIQFSTKSILVGAMSEMMTLGNPWLAKYCQVYYYRKPNI